MGATPRCYDGAEVVNGPPPQAELVTVEGADIMPQPIVIRVWSDFV